MPSKEIDIPKYRWYRDVYYDRLNGTVLHDVYREYVASRFQMGKHWVRTPNWKQAKKEGNLPMNPFSFTKIVSARGGGYTGHSIWKNSNGQVILDHENILDGPGLPYLDPITKPSASSEKLIQRANTKMLLQLKNQKINLMQTLGERHQTARLFSTTVRRIVTAVGQLRKLNWNGAAQTLGVKPSRQRHRAHSSRMARDPKNAISQGWLELQYGWRPLLGEIYGALELIQYKRAKNPLTRSTASVSDVFEHKTSFTYDDYSIVYITTKRKMSVKFTAFYTAPEENLKTLSEVGITNPFHTAWELLPWSFVLDWLLHVGNFISSWDAVTGLSFTKGTRTIVDEWWSLVEQKGRSVTLANGGRAWRDINAWASCHQVELSRVPTSGFPPVSLPVAKNPFSAEHLANLAALLSTTFRR